MSDQWLYRIQGQEYGPVSLDLVRSLVASGAIALDDEVRHLDRANWILACAASELRSSVQQQSISLAVERRCRRDEWYCRGATGDFGPLKIVDLIELAVRGELSPDEEIKSRVDDYWQQIHTIERLLELLPFPGEIREISNIHSRQSFTDATHLSIYQDKEDRELNVSSSTDPVQERDECPIEASNGLASEMSCDSTASSIIPFPGMPTSLHQDMDEESIARWTLSTS